MLHGVVRCGVVLRGVAAWTVLIGTAMCTLGCGAGFNSASLQVKPDSGSAQIGALRINGVVVVADPATRAAEVIAAVANTGPGSNQLVSVTADGFPATVRPALTASPLAGLPGNDVTLVGNTVSIASGSAVSFGQPGRPALQITDGSFVPGHVTQVEFGFAGVGQTTVSALVMSNTGLFASYNVGAGQSLASSPVSSAGPSAKPSSSVSSSPGASASGTAGTSASPLPSPSAAAYLSSSPTPVAASIAASASAMASSLAASAVAKASTTLARIPHPYGSREPRR